MPEYMYVDSNDSPKTRCYHIRPYDIIALRDIAISFNEGDQDAVDIDLQNGIPVYMLMDDENKLYVRKSYSDEKFILRIFDYGFKDGLKWYQVIVSKLPDSTQDLSLDEYHISEYRKYGIKICNM